MESLPKNTPSNPEVVSSLYDLKTATLPGDPVDLACYRGRVTLVVNLASRCGYTPQYAGLEELHREFSGRGFAVLGFPSNDFGAQEPGTPGEIANFCQSNYGVTFPLFAKLSTRPGPGQSPIYQFLGRAGALPDWNFSKYLVGQDGRVRSFFAAAITPDSAVLRGAIMAALAEQ
jgi:glutathione peroxidase